MPFSLEKEYYKIEELADRWKITAQDLEYLILTKCIPVYIFLSNAVLEVGNYNITDHGRILHMPKDVHEFTGLKQLRREDLDSIIRNDFYEVHDFMPDGKFHYIRLTNFKAAFKVRLHDLILRTEDCREMEISREIQYMSKARKCGQVFTYENDFKMVKIGDDIFHFGEMQASVIKQLYDLALDENKDPWEHGKILLHNAGSTSHRMNDVFKNKKEWRKLIEGNGKGYYRFVPSIIESAGQKMAA